ncbi:MAG TPA: ATP-grasp fold amidoligase family protein [Propylenella sp.]|nr:ATP-grasp fold amidoligase family protein [Propylenella sp.]
MTLRTPCRWTEFIHLRMRGTDTAFKRYDKFEVDSIARELGLRSAPILGILDRPAGFDDSGLPDAFVLKPVDMTNKRGVMLLRRLPGGTRFYEMLLRREMTREDIVAEQQRWRTLWKQNRRGPYRLIVQEMVVGENGPEQIPNDYKAYVFDGVIKLIIQGDRNTTPPSYYFYLGEFGPLAYPTHIQANWEQSQLGERAVPKCRDALLDAARTVSLALKTPFISVDLYAGIDGPVIGELTSTPGNPYFKSTYSFTPAFDEELGRAWLDALQRLGMEPPLFDESDARIRRPTGLPGAKKIAKGSAKARGQTASHSDRVTAMNPPLKRLQKLGLRLAKRAAVLWRRRSSQLGNRP